MTLLGGALRLVVTTDVVGRFELCDVADGVPFSLHLAGAVLGSGIELERGEVLDLGDLAVNRGVPVNVVVTDTEGVALGDVRVTAHAVPEEESGLAFASLTMPAAAAATAVTDADGCARLDLLQPGRWTFRAEADGKAVAGACDCTLDPDSDGETVVIRLARGYRIWGLVTDGAGNPVFPAQVVAAADRSLAAGAAAPLRARAETDPGGRYELGRLSRGEFDLWLIRPGCDPLRAAAVAVPELTHMDLVWSAGGCVDGCVTGPAGEPLEGVSVRVTARSPWNTVSATGSSDASGRYVVRGLPECLVTQVEAESPGLLQDDSSAAVRRTALGPGDTLSVNITMRPGSEVRGVVLGPDGPVARASVTLAMKLRGDRALERDATADAQGRFEFRGVPAGRALMRPSAPGLVAPGFPRDIWTALSAGAEDSAWSIAVTTGDCVHDLVMIPGSRLAGRVRDTGGAPVAGAQVQAVDRLTRSGADGSFLLDGLPWDAPIELAVSHPEHVPVQAVVEDRTSEEVLVVTLQRGAPVTGTLRTLGEAAASGAYVQVGVLEDEQDGEPDWSDLPRHPVARDGQYAATVLARVGAFVVRGVADGRSVSSDRLPIDPQASAYRVDLIAKPGCDVRGRVIDASTGLGVAGALVACGPAPADPSRRRDPPIVRAKTDDAGEFLWSGAREGWAELVVTAKGMAPFVDAVEIGAEARNEPVLVELHPARSIGGSVRDTSQVAVEGALVTCVPVSARGLPVPIAPRSTRADGSFRFDGLTQGTYRLRVEGSVQGAGGGIVATSVDEVEAGALDVVVVLERALSIEGRVVDDEAQPVAGAWVEARAEVPGSPHAGSAQTAHDGSFRVDGLVVGRYTLTALTRGAYRPAVRRAVGTGSTGVEIRVARGLCIRGRLVDAKGTSVAGVSLEIEPIAESADAPGQLLATTRPEGDFVFGGLAPGEYRIGLFDEEGPTVIAGRVLSGGERVLAGADDVLLRIEQGAAISGLVTGPDGAPVSGLRISARTSAGADERSCVADGRGRFQVAGLVAGQEYELTVAGGRYRRRTLGPVPAGVEGVRIEVVEGLSVSGRVIDARDTPIAGAQVRLIGELDRVDVDTDDTGRFDVHGLAPGTYTVRIQAMRVVGGVQTTLGVPCDAGDVVAGSADVVLRWRER